MNGGEGTNVLRQLIIVVALVNVLMISYTMLAYLRQIRKVPEHERVLPYSLLGVMGSKGLLIFVATQHVYAHLSDNSAKQWELWITLAALFLGLAALASFVKRKDPRVWMTKDDG